MKQVIAAMPAFDPQTGDLNVIIETPKGSRTKFVWDEETGLFEMHKLLPAGMAFPFDYGFIPSTLTEDGDPIDVLIVSDGPLFTGCRVKARLIGGLRGEQTPTSKPKKKEKKARKAKQSAKGKDNGMERNDRLFAVPVLPTIPDVPDSMDDLGGKMLKDLESFFETYSALEGKTFKVLRTMTRREAESFVKQSRNGGKSKG